MDIKITCAILICVMFSNLSYAETERHKFERAFPKRIELFAVQYYMCAYRLYEAYPNPSQKEELSRRVDGDCIQKERQFTDSLSSLKNISESPTTSFLHYRMLVMEELFMKMDGKLIPGDNLSCSDAIDEYKKEYISCIKDSANEIIIYSDESASVIVETAGIKCDKIPKKYYESIKNWCAYTNFEEVGKAIDIFKNKYKKILMGEIVNLRVELQKRKEQQYQKKREENTNPSSKKREVDA